LEIYKELWFQHPLEVITKMANTNYFGPGNTTLQTSEPAARTVIPYVAVVSKLYVRTGSSQPGSGSLVFTVLQNGSSTAITITVASGSSGGIYSDTTHSFTTAAGDEISIQVVNNATGSSASIEGWSIEVTRTS
jgi:hypothetical protein